jgi:hypothetical protein
MEVAATLDAPLVVDDVAAEPETVEPETVEDPGEPEAVALPLARAVSAPGVGAPKVETPDGIGPTSAEAEAPMPTKNPTPCPGFPEEDLARFWKAVKVLDPEPGALMAPTIPDLQWGVGKSCLQ